MGNLNFIVHVYESRGQISGETETFFLWEEKGSLIVLHHDYRAEEV